MHYHLTINQLLVGAFAFTIILIFGLAAFLEEFIKKPPPFRNYFAVEQDNDFEQGAWDEDAPLNRRSRLTPFNLRDTDLASESTPVGATQQDRGPS
jgi:hypothetical protein